RSYMVGGIGALLGLGGLVDEGLERIDEAQATAEEFDDVRAIGWLNWTRCIVLYANLRFIEAFDVGKLSMSQLEGAGDLWMLCDAAGWTSLALVASGIVEEGVEVATQGDELATRLDHIGAQILLRRALLFARGSSGI